MRCARSPTQGYARPGAGSASVSASSASPRTSCATRRRRCCSRATSTTWRWRIIYTTPTRAPCIATPRSAAARSSARSTCSTASSPMARALLRRCLPDDHQLVVDRAIAATNSSELRSGRDRQAVRITARGYLSRLPSLPTRQQSQPSIELSVLGVSLDGLHDIERIARTGERHGRVWLEALVVDRLAVGQIPPLDSQVEV